MGGGLILSTDTAILLPPLILLVAAIVFLAASRVNALERGWQPLCVLVVAAAGGALALGDRFAPATDALLAGEIVRGRLASFVSWLTLGTGLLLALAGRGWADRSRRPAGIYAFMMVGLAGTLFAAAANDVVVLWLALEVVAVATTMLLFASHGGRWSEASVKHFLLSLLSWGLALAGIAILYGLTGSTRISEIQSIYADSYLADGTRAGNGSHLGVTGIVLLLAGIGFRYWLVPFHFGNPDICHGTSAWMTGWLCSIPKLAAFVALVRLIGLASAGFEDMAMLVLPIVAAATMLAGSGLALLQTNVRRILAYSATFHMGFALLGLAAAFDGSPIGEAAGDAGLLGGVAAATFFLGSSVVSLAGVCIILVFLKRQDRDVDYIDDLAGLIRSQPAAAVCILVFLLNLVGIPPLPGFWGRLFVISSASAVRSELPRSAVVEPHAGFLIVGLVAALSLVMVATMYLRLLLAICFEPQVGTPRPGGGQSALAAATLAAIVTVGCGLIPSPILGYLNQARMVPIPQYVEKDAAEPGSNFLTAEGDNF